MQVVESAVGRLVSTREPTDIDQARFICDVHGHTNHVMGAPGGAVFCIECSGALARMIYRTSHQS